MTYAEEFLRDVRNRYKYQPEFVQSIEELITPIRELLEKRPDFRKASILERITEPDRILSFRVTWIDDDGVPRVNRGYRVQFSSLLGPYKGGLRFHPTVTVSILKFLGFEQIFKNSLTGLWLGAAKGGADFDPKGKSEGEVMRFCQSFMTELANYIGPDTDIPAGDIGVGAREIGYMFGWYKKLVNEFHGSLTGKGIDWGGSNLRPEATGYGLLYFLEAMLNEAGTEVAGKKIVISGSGNVAQYAADKAITMGATVIALSDSQGYVHEPGGFTPSKLAYLKRLKNQRRGRISEYAKKYPSAKFVAGAQPWELAADIYLPCATQNEIDDKVARLIVKHKPLAIAEGANMPSTPKAIDIFLKHRILFGPAKASNAGGVAVSGLEMAQNSSRISLSLEEIDDQLKKIMHEIHGRCVENGRVGKVIDYRKGANVAAFLRVGEAMLAQGIT